MEVEREGCCKREEEEEERGREAFFSFFSETEMPGNEPCLGHGGSLIDAILFCRPPRCAVFSCSTAASL